jgi:hypothetical protein
MPPRNKNKRKGKGKGKSNTSASVLTCKFKEYALRVTQGTSGLGGLTSVGSNTSLSNGSLCQVNPYNMGGRFNNMAEMFLKWRILKITVDYLPTLTTSSGVVEVVTGSTTTPAYADRGFAMGLYEDPAVSAATYYQIIVEGGVACNTSKRARLTYSNPKNAPWLYTSTTSASPSNIDLRTSAPLEFRFNYYQASTTAAQSYGDLVFNITAQFRGPVNPAASVGSAIRTMQGPTIFQRSHNFSDEVKDEDDEKSVTLTRSLTDEEWSLVLSKRRGK